eukprot:SAG11_NODE_1074_length_5968_cov_2.041063_6_plen_77_part_00
MVRRAARYECVQLDLLSAAEAVASEVEASGVAAGQLRFAIAQHPEALIFPKVEERLRSLQVRCLQPPATDRAGTRF